LFGQFVFEQKLPIVFVFNMVLKSVLLGVLYLNELLLIIFFSKIMHGWYSDKIVWGEFIYHPFLMTVAFGIMGPISTTVYFVFEHQLGILDHQTAKYLHALMHFVATILGLVGILDMWKVHADKDVGHFMSIHSWIGIVIYSIWCLQFLMGAYMYLISNNMELKKAFMPYHKSVGKFLTMAGLWVIILGELSYKARGDNVDKEELLWKTMMMFTLGLILSIHMTIHTAGDHIKVEYGMIKLSESESK